MGLRHTTVKSFKYAFQGLHTALKNEPNFRVHIVIAILTLTAGCLLGLTSIEWLFLTFTIFYVLTFELLNTVLEAMVDLVSPEITPSAKIAKDVSAACVLLGAFMAIVVGVTLFLPKIILLFK
jgi:diacylglycerol kinase